MKISEFIDSLWDKYNSHIKIVKKWIFWVILNEEAFFFSKYFNMKLTVLDTKTIKVWFPDWSKNKWINILEENNISYILFEKINGGYNKTKIFASKQFSSIYKIDLEDYNFTKNRLLWLNKIWLEDKNEHNFLLKDKLEDIYMILLELLLKLPKKERYFFREKIEKQFLDLFEQVYIYMYNLWDRKIIIKNIFNITMILREFTRFLYKLWKIKNDNVYLDLWDKWIEILKICKGIMKKN